MRTKTLIAASVAVLLASPVLGQIAGVPGGKPGVIGSDKGAGIGNGDTPPANPAAITPANPNDAASAHVPNGPGSAGTSSNPALAPGLNPTDPTKGIYSPTTPKGTAQARNRKPDEDTNGSGSSSPDGASR